MAAETIGAALVGIACAGYLWWRRVRADNAGDRLQLQTSAAVEVYKTIAADATRRYDELLKTIERVAKERNEAVQQVGRLEATVTHLSEQVDGLKADLEHLEKVNDELRATIDEQSLLLQSMQKVNNTILDELQAFKGMKGIPAGETATEGPTV